MGHRRFEMRASKFPGQRLLFTLLTAAAVATGCGGGGGSDSNPPPDTTAPTLSAISAAPTASGATITWSTNENADSQVEYGPTTAYGSSTTLATTMVMSHSVDITGLTASTTYHYRVKSKDASSNLATGTDQTFTTSAAADTTPPVISAIVAVPAMTSASITWTTNEAADSQVEYGTTAAYGSSTTLATALVTAHTVNVPGLTAGTQYHFRVKSKDAATNLATSADGTFTTVAADTTPPTVSAVVATPSLTGATITWTTNEPADTQVAYGATASYGSSSPLVTTLVTSHSVSLSGLTPGTLYHYNIKTKDAAGNPAPDVDRTFTTTADTVAPTVSISAPTAGNVSGTITVTATASDNVGVVGVQFKLDVANLGSEDTTSPYSVSWNTTTASNASHALTATARDAAGNSATSAAVNVTVNNAGGSSIFPLHTDPTKHYLIDKSGNPFFVNGDTPWDLSARLSDPQIITYLDDRQAKGINTILVELMDHENWTSDGHAPNNFYGEPPFTTAGDFSTPNEAYMARVATMLQAALDRNMLVMITPAYAGFAGGSQGWWVEMQANGATKLRAFGQYVATRFAAYPNIVWVQGGDYAPSNHALFDAIANGIRDIDSTTWLQTFHGDRGTDALNYTTAAWLTLNCIYTDGSPSTIVSHANAQYPKMMPFFLIESAYETGSAGDGSLVRPQLYANNLSGATGYLLGYEDLWVFASGWQTLLNSQGARAMKYAGQLWNSRAWEKLVPDGTGDVAYASDGSFAFSYIGNGSQSINMTKFSTATVAAQWYDPTNGTFSAVSGSPFPNTGTRSFSHAGANAEGSSDWVLVLDSQ